MKELIPPIIKTWEDRMVDDPDKTCEAAMYHETLELRSALVEYQQAYANKKTEIDALLLANRDLYDWFDALKVDYDALEAENQCRYRDKYA